MCEREKLNFDDFKEQLKTVKLLSLDVDGILTDGGLYYTETGDELRKFNVKDGMGMKKAREAGVELCIISASTTNAIQERGKRLGLSHVYTGAKNKIEILQKICDELDISLDNVAHMGDDLNDISIMEKIGTPITVDDAVEEVKAHTVYITQKKGGCGAVREICDLLIKLNS
ncbi:HAD-IA family hydrolase [Terasakiella sp. A23]|uniref:KdsC family phosphatase n=1 Tax=Terasakiella sp. FCG-A23 TaxID=3080561 RepID=UPI00295581E2|nr:HAD-IA family hydrolase [Terasakiella sp. A23]MDV7340092.1 HAD-IA family hydrolase [Terasakiella sp. A23]